MHGSRFCVTHKCVCKIICEEKALRKYKFTRTLYCLRYCLCDHEVVHLKKSRKRGKEFSLLWGMLKYSRNYHVSAANLPQWKENSFYIRTLLTEIMLKFGKLISHEVFKLEMKWMYQIKRLKIFFLTICNTNKINYY